MISSIIAAILALARALASFFEWFGQRQLIEAGKSEARAEAEKNRIDEIRRADEAREQAGRDAEKDIDRDDGFCRD